MAPPPVEELLGNENIIDTGNGPEHEDEKLDEFRENMGGPTREWGELLTHDEEEEDDDDDAKPEGEKF